MVSQEVIDGLILLASFVGGWAAGTLIFFGLMELVAWARDRWL